MAEIRDSEDLRVWLEGRPRDVVIAVAARAALRAAPFVGRAYESGYVGASTLALATFRASAIATIAVEQHNLGDVRAYVDADAAAYADAAYAAARAAAAWREVSIDCTFIDERAATAPRETEATTRSDDLGRALLAQPLVAGSSTGFFGANPGAAPLDFLPAQEDWDVWTGWWTARLNGAALDRAFEQAFLSITEEEWNFDPPTVNALLKERLSAERAADENSDPDPSALEQRPAVFVFGVANDNFSASPYRSQNETKSNDLDEVLEELSIQIAELLGDLERDGLENRPLAKLTVAVLNRLSKTLNGKTADALNRPLLATQARRFIGLAWAFNKPEGAEEFADTEFHERTSKKR